MATIIRMNQGGGTCSGRCAVNFVRRRKLSLVARYTTALVLAFSIVNSTVQPAVADSISSSDQQKIMALRVRCHNAEIELQANQAALNKPGTSDQQRAALSSRATQLHDEIDRATKEEQQIVK